MLPAELDIDPDQLHAALTLLQSFDPAGVGARDLAESLRLQLAAVRAEQPDRAAPEAFALARALIDHHLALLAAKDFARIKRLLHCDDAALREAQALIRSLNPRPGAAFSIDEPTYVIPDVVVRRTRAGWTAQLNPDVLPKLRINDMYAQILRRNRGAGAGGLGAQLQEARWLIQNVQPRFETILRVSQAIVERQKAFFSHGEVAMRPLVLREIAEELGLHESTVSRVTTQKFMLTPSGTFELKYFFGSHVATEAGGAASSTAIRALIRQLVAAEDPQQPLSDSRLAEMLGEQGIVVARRTVAKYRESLQIAPVAQRKVL
jgi:RNA polymerase sigma-54 factor